MLKGGFLMSREKGVVVPKIKGFLCITAHSDGLKKRVENQINLQKIN